MITKQHIIYHPSRSDRFAFWHLTDTHIGAAACDEKMFQRDVDSIAANPNAYWGFGGDACEFIGRKGDKRHRENTLAPWLWGEEDIIAEQINRFAGIIKPIAHKCLYFGCGNHEDSMLSHHGRNVYLELLRRVADLKGCEIGDIATGWEAFVILKFRRGTKKSYGTKTIVVYYHHGAGGGRKAGGHGLRMEEVLLTYGCDLAFIGHRHYRDVAEKEVILPDLKKGYKEVRRVGVWGGSYYRPYIGPDKNGVPVNTYAQSKQLPPRPTGMLPVIIVPDKKDYIPILSRNPAETMNDFLK